MKAFVAPLTSDRSNTFPLTLLRLHAGPVTTGTQETVIPNASTVQKLGDRGIDLFGIHAQIDNGLRGFLCVELAVARKLS
jgi:hypothetical protein